MRSIEVATVYGPGRLQLFSAHSPQATVLLSHGAGTGVGTLDLQALAHALPESGFSVALFEQPWVVAGKHVASPPSTLDVGLRAAVSALCTTIADAPLILGGRSAGARSACRVAAESAVACLALSFPLHPPGRPEKSRLEELLQAGVPTLVVQGSKDAFGRPEEFPATVEVMPVEAADHSFKTAKSSGISPEQTAATIVAHVLRWLRR